jgi:hypothetical protein
MFILRIVTVLVSLLVVGEATALAIGMHIIKKSESPWISLKNDLLLAMDIVVGLLLILLAYDGATFPQPVWFPLFAIVGLITHLFRIWEYLAGRASAFCHNRPLFILNNFKFTGLFLILMGDLLI